MLCASVPCVSYGTYSPSVVLPSPAFFTDSSSLFYTPRPLLLFLPSFILQIISCVVIAFPLLTVSLPLATLCVCVCVLSVCLWWLMAGHWPLPLLGKLCLCPWGLQICATPEPKLQLWAQAGAKSLLLLLLIFTSSSPPPWTISDKLWLDISYRNSQGLYLCLPLIPLAMSYLSNLFIHNCTLSVTSSSHCRITDHICYVLEA